MDSFQEKRSSMMKEVMSQTVRSMNENQKKMRQYLEKNIPEAFPLSDNMNAYSNEFQHTQHDHLGMQFVLAQLDDGLSPHDLLGEMSDIIKQFIITLNIFYPRSLNSNESTLNLGQDFSTIVKELESYIGELQEIQKAIFEGKQSNVTECINADGMEKMKKHLIVLGYEFMLNHQIPQELLFAKDFKYNKSMLENVAKNLTSFKKLIGGN